MTDEAMRRRLEAEGSRGPETDPKGAAGRAKVQLVGISPAALVLLGEVMRQGSVKYGDFNWSSERMKASTYYAASLRHLLQWWTGEERDAESGVDHLAHLMACAMILLEQRASGRLIDDRPGMLVVPFAEAVAEVRAARERFDAARPATQETVATVTFEGRQRPRRDPAKNGRRIVNRMPGSDRRVLKDRRGVVRP